MKKTIFMAILNDNPILVSIQTKYIEFKVELEPESTIKNIIKKDTIVPICLRSP
ncbi:hypothetical protein ACH5RX_002595 [Enterococcus faecalis]|nr:hypothetical protein [Enterococcus faecalis]ELT8948083.1 hypothetical protein [Enterococcus faecalis]